METDNKIIIFGGSGFVGFHLINLLIKKYDRHLTVIIVDINKPLIDHEMIYYVYSDLTSEFDCTLLDKFKLNKQSIIINLIALSKIPGFKKHEYFNTNILSSKNIVKAANQLFIEKIIFISSMSVYGAREDLVDEKSILMPDNPYGSSKVISENIHKEWMCKNVNNKLIIFRPSIIFGKHENANMTRLIRSLKKKYFFYPGRTDTIKSCVYVKDVARAIVFGINNFDDCKFKLYNLSNPNRLTIKEIVGTIKNKLDISMYTFTVPLNIIIFFSYIITIYTRLFFNKESNFDPDRVKKLTVSTNIDTENLLKDNFEYKYNFADAIGDWMEKDN